MPSGPPRNTGQRYHPPSPRSSPSCHTPATVSTKATARADRRPVARRACIHESVASPVSGSPSDVAGVPLRAQTLVPRLVKFRSSCTSRPIGKVAAGGRGLRGPPHRLVDVLLPHEAYGDENAHDGDTTQAVAARPRARMTLSRRRRTPTLSTSSAASPRPGASMAHNAQQASGSQDGRGAVAVAAHRTLLATEHNPEAPPTRSSQRRPQRSRNADE